MCTARVPPDAARAMFDFSPKHACRFVTKQELEGLGMGHLVGSQLLRAYMHGFFLHNKLYQKAKAVAAPLAYDTVRKERIQSKLEAERSQRITLKRKLPKVCMPLTMTL